MRLSCLSIPCRLSLAVVLAAAISVSAQKRVDYGVTYSIDSPGRLQISISPNEPIREAVSLVIPRAIPSGYGLQFYDRFVENVSAHSSSGSPLSVPKAEHGPRWIVPETDGGIVRITYEVNLKRLEMEVLSAADRSIARDGYVGLLGYSVLGYLDGYEKLPISLRVKGPDGWPVFLTLAPKAAAEKGAATADAEDFFDLADSQIAMGPKLNLRRLNTEPPAYIALYSETDTNVDKHAEVFERAYRKVLDYFGDAQFDNYTAHIEIVKPVSESHRYGFSMEHKKSSTYYLAVDRAYTKDTLAETYFRDESNYIHHIAHSWIPKKVYGVGYLPFTWELPPLIDTVWFNEGFARFAMIEIRADSMSPEAGKEFRERYLAALQRWIDNQPPLIRDMPLVELSRIGSVMYAEDFRTGQTLFSKGALMADEIDRLIREKTNGKSRLRDSMRALVDWGVKNKRPFRLDELPRLIAEPVKVEESEIRNVVEKWLSSGRSEASRQHRPQPADPFTRSERP